MTIKKNLFIWIIKPGSKKPKKITLKRLLKAVNANSFQSQFFANEKDAAKYLKEVIK
tara:strand:- start:410 stop:580 length:171 start_codon:yes stop_codon:yes gene_type:complete